MKPETNQLIQIPSRSSPAGTVIIFAVVLLCSIMFLSSQPNAWFAVTAVLLLIAAALFRQTQALHLAFFTVLFAVPPALHPAFITWPLNLLVPSLLYLAVTLSVPRFRSSPASWLRRGRSGGDIALLVIMIAVVSGAGLYIWYRLLKPDLSIQLGYMPVMTPWLFLLAGLGFAIGNAALEEFVFRGIVMQALDSAVGAGMTSIILQGWLFGAAHYLRGFPRGEWGLVMAAIYGIMLGAIRRRSEGMLAPWIAHVCADLVIFGILSAVALGQ